jgi:hypothetical protein
MGKSYEYAVVPSQGRYGSGDTVYTLYRTDDLDKARRRAAKATREFQDAMRPHGGTSGGYRVVPWGSDADRTVGHALDRVQSA